MIESTSALGLVFVVLLQSCIAAEPPGALRTQASTVPCSKPVHAPASPVHAEIWCSSWSRVPADCGFITPMMFLPGSLGPNHATPMGSSAVDLARRSRSLPVGRVAIQWWRYSNSLFAPNGTNWLPDRSDVAPHPWDLSAVRAVAREWSAWLRDYKFAGGRLDLLVGDCERWSIFSNWGMQRRDVDRIASDSRANVAMFGEPPLRSLLGSTVIGKVNAPDQSGDYLKWNQAIGTLTAGAMREAIWSPAVAHFPALKGSNYGGVVMTDRPAPDLNGHAQPHSNVFGTAAAPVAYGQVECASTAWFIDSQDPTRLSKNGFARLERTPWCSFVMDQQLGRACKRSDLPRPLQPWIAMTAWTGVHPGTVCYSVDPRYHDEMVRHYALLGTEVFLFWNPEAATVGAGAMWTSEERDRAARRLNAVLSEVNLHSKGVVQRPVTTEPIAFDTPIVTTGAQRSDGLWLWRTTVRDDVTELRDARTGVRVNIDAGCVGRWDVTETCDPPAYSAGFGARQRSAPAAIR